jgi:hypothetical protein
VTLRLLGLAEANAVMTALGFGLLPLLRFRPRPLLAERLALAYAVGLAATGVIAANLAVVHVPADWWTLAPLAAAVLVLARWRRPAATAAPVAPPRLDAVTLAALVALAAFLAKAAALLAVKPLLEFDGWAIWATRARALYELGAPMGPVFTDPVYPALQHPLLLPALEALDGHFMGTFDGTAIHLQLLGFALALTGGAWTLLRPLVAPPLLAVTLLAIVVAPAFFDQLATNYADVPLAVFVALGVACLGAWLRSNERELLVAAALFLGAAALTKNEGELFALAAYAAAAFVCGRSRLRALAVAAAATAAVDLPWRIWIAAHHVGIAEYSLTDLFDLGYLREHSDRVRPAAHELLAQILRTPAWSFLVPLALVGLAGALALGAPRAGAFAAAWLLLAYAGLLAIYWISTNPVTSNLYNSSNRTVDSIVVAAALLAPVLLAPGSAAERPEERSAREREQCGEPVRDAP